VILLNWEENSYVYVIPGIFLRVTGSVTVDITLPSSMTAKGTGNLSAITKTYLVWNIYFEYCTAQVEQCIICEDKCFKGRNEAVFKIGLIPQP
jgi:hypothetical protein